MKFSEPKFILAALTATSLALLTSCGEGEAKSDPVKPAFGKTEKVGGDKPEREPRGEGKGDRRERGDGEGKGRRGFSFADRDTDGDGGLSREEMGDMGWLMMGRADEDGDGKVTEAEAQAFREKGDFRPPAPSEMISVLDKDGDGKLGVSELPERMRDRMSEADADGDGVITVGEMEARRAAREAERALNPDQGRGRGRGPGGFGRPGGGGPGGGGRPGGPGGGGPGDGGGDPPL